MSIKSGFFNSINNDRLYSALDMGKIFDGLIHDGVFATIGDHMMVTSRGGYRIQVGTGKAWFDHTYTIVEPAHGLTVEPADPILKRIDAVVLETNNLDQVRRNTVKIIKGNPSSNPVRPTLIREDRVNQYPLAYISVQNGITEITQVNITNTVGTSECPFVTAVNQSVTVDELVQQWMYEWNKWVNDHEEEFNKWQAAEKQSFVDWERGIQFEFEEWRNNKKKDFDDWWSDIIDILKEVPIGEWAVRLVDAEKDIAELNRHIDTYEEYGQKFYRTTDYKPHIVELVNNSYGSLNSNEYLLPGVYTFADGSALKNTNHAPVNNISIPAAMYVYSATGASVKEIDTALKSTNKPFTVFQEIEYGNGVYPKFKREITQNTSTRLFGPWRAEFSHISKRNIAVTTANWSDSGIEGMPYKAVLDVPGITSDWMADITFDIASVLSGNLASFSDTTTNGVIIYAKSPVAATVSLVTCKFAGCLDREVIK